jgi:hypothetical protein
MIISLDNLRAGLVWWRGTSGWGGDIANEDYAQIYSDRDAGITTEWWDKTVSRLGKWRAYRGPKKPNTRLEITERGLRTLEEVATESARLLANVTSEPDIAHNDWESVAPLYSLVIATKNSQVFASKMCHFLFPNLFIVMDNVAIDVSEYEVYWRGMRDAWLSFAEKNAAKQILRDVIEPGQVLHPRYPFDTKIIELSHIGQKHRTNNAPTKK